jgi:prepilin-type N-terminal cleavage/methylation domain-containing protein
MKKEKSDPKVSEGFTLIELIVSVVIISVVCVVGYHFISKLW